MKKIVPVLIAVVVVGVAAYFGMQLIGSAVSSSVDLEVAKMIDRENSNLPRTVGQSVSLQHIENLPDEKQIVFHYQFEADIPSSRFDEVETTTNQRVINDSQIKRAMNHGVKILHQFADLNETIVLEFETVKQ